jgi:hypothetical protein
MKRNGSKYKRKMFSSILRCILLVPNYITHDTFQIFCVNSLITVIKSTSTSTQGTAVDYVCVSERMVGEGGRGGCSWTRSMESESFDSLDHDR